MLGFIVDMSSCYVPQGYIDWISVTDRKSHVSIHQFIVSSVHKFLIGSPRPVSAKANLHLSAEHPVEASEAP